MKKADLISKVLERIPEYTELEVSQVLEVLDEIGVLNTSFDAASNGLLNECDELQFVLDKTGEAMVRILEERDLLKKTDGRDAQNFG